MKKPLVKLMIAVSVAAMLVVMASQVTPVVNQETPGKHHAPSRMPPPGIRHLEKVEDLVLEMTNQVRRAKGVAPLIKDDELREMARAYSDDMLVRGFFDHTDPDGVPFYERISNNYHHHVRLVGENIWDARDYDPDKAKQVAQEIMDSWLTSPGHRENLLDPEFTHLGVGVSARHNRIRATQEFVKRPKFIFF